MNTEEKETQENEVVDTVTEETVVEQENENDDFDPSAFINQSENEKKEGEDQEPVDTKEEEEKDEVDEVVSDDDSIWDTFETETEEEEEEEEVESEQEEVETAEVDTSTGGDEFGEYEVISKFKELGIDASNMEDLYAKVEGVIEDRKVYQESQYTNKRIETWKNYLNLDDKQIVIKNYEIEGETKERAEELANKLEANDLVDVEAQKIRAAIRGSIQREVKAEKSRTEQDVARQQQDVVNAQKLLKDHLDNTQTMFGFKMGKENDLPKIRDKHFEYIKSGKFFEEVASNPDILSKAAWFVRHEKQITKALQNKGIQTGKQEVLAAINNPSDNNSMHIATPDGDKEFNAQKFIQSETMD